MALSWLHRMRKRKLTAVSRTGLKGIRQKRFVPKLEGLADRVVPAAFHVPTLADSGAGSLRDAILRANAHAGADVIVFDEGLTGTIALTGGELDVTDNVRINCPGADRLTADTGCTQRVARQALHELQRAGYLVIKHRHT